MLKLTPEEIDAKRSPRGGWTRETLAGWGIPWPPPTGWRRALIAGAPIPTRYAGDPPVGATSPDTAWVPAIGEEVEKYVGGYGGPGIVRMVWTDGEGITRVIVGHRIEGGWGELQHIYSPKQIRPLPAPPAAPDAGELAELNGERTDELKMLEVLEAQAAELATLRAQLAEEQAASAACQHLYDEQTEGWQRALADASKRIAEWNANVEAMLKDCPFAVRMCEGNGPEELVGSLAITWVKALKRIAELEVGLRPFAYDPIPSRRDDERVDITPLAGDLRRARALLSTAEKGSG